jgi:hypothetical protein
MADLSARQAALFDKLKELGIPHDTKEHKQCFTVDDVERYNKKIVTRHA